VNTTLSRHERDHDPPEGEYVLRVDKVDRDDDRLVWSLTIDAGPHRGSRWEYFTSLKPAALWNLRNVLECMGVKVIDGPMTFDWREFVGLTVGAAIKDGRIIDFFPVDDDCDQAPIAPRLEIAIERATAALIARCQKAAGRRRV
jgi:hypothetical protein